MAQPVWITPTGTIGGLPSGEVIRPIQLSATPVAPAVSLTYQVIGGALPSSLSMNETGLIYGSADAVYENTTFTFVVRVTDNLGNLADRTFSLVVSGADAPSFVSPTGSILVTQDSVWTELQVRYSSPISDSNILIRLVQGQLPPGLEINEYGLIRGYPTAPYSSVNTGRLLTTAIDISNNIITCYNTSGFTPGRPIIFSGAIMGGLVSGRTYYVKTVESTTTFTISTSVDGPVVELSDAVGYMDVALPDVSVPQPIVKTYDFTLKIESSYGSSVRTYSITVVNQNASTVVGGPGKPVNTRVPTILNTRPLEFFINPNDPNYSYYVLPPQDHGMTYPPSSPAYIGKFTSDNLFSFRILGYDFDDSQIEYVFADLSPGLIGDSATGWVTGIPEIASNSISVFGFSVSVRKKNSPLLESPFFQFSFTLKNNIDGNVTWLTSSSLGTIFNNTESVFTVKAVSDVSLEYELVSGSLPANLSLLKTGEVVGTVAFQPTTDLLSQNDSTSFAFTVKAYSPQFPVVNSLRTFTLTVLQEFSNPMDTLYIKCTPSIEDREILNTLLNNNALIPYEYLYRPEDPNFGKSTEIIYEHAYGINATNFDAYVEAVTKNHYWRNITLGEIKTAIARDQYTGEILYEVVYSSIYDNLVNYNEVDLYDISEQSTALLPEGESISKEIVWPRLIPLSLGEWYTSETDVFTSYVLAPNGQQYYTSLTPGYAKVLYPNSLPNMRMQVVDVLGQEQNTNVMPLWMTSQQTNGSSLGFVPAWVICYTKPGYSQIVKDNIDNNWKTPAGSKLALNLINFKIDRFTVDKSQSYNYDNNLNPPAWINLPSATPVPDPKDSQNFYVWFPQQTILPDKTQY